MDIIFVYQFTSLHHSHSFPWRQALQCSPLLQFVVGWGPRVSVHCVACNAVVTPHY